MKALQIVIFLFLFLGSISSHAKSCVLEPEQNNQVQITVRDQTETTFIHHCYLRSGKLKIIASETKKRLDACSKNNLQGAKPSGVRYHKPANRTGRKSNLSNPADRTGRKHYSPPSCSDGEEPCGTSCCPIRDIVR